MLRSGPSLKPAQILGLLAAIAAPRAARADGAFPASDAVLLPVNRPQEIILSTNFGLIITDDGGATWQWTCEQAATSMASSYALGAPPQELLYARSSEVGLAVSDDTACTWRRAGGVLADAVATDFFPDPTEAAHVLAIVGGAADAGVATNAVYESRDGGETFGTTPLYTAAAGEQVTGVEIAARDARIIYVAVAAPGPHPFLARSDDGGATWTTADLQPSLGARSARIIAVDPADANVVYLRAIGAGSELLAVTRDGGTTLTTPVTVPGGALSAFARLASGTVLVAGLVPGEGGTTNGAGWRSTDGGITFDDWTPAPMPRLRALAERAGVLYLAGDNFLDGWALAVSSDEGRTIQPLAGYQQVSAVMACVAAVCGSSCLQQASRNIWPRAVCGSAIDGGRDAGAPPPAPSGCGCSSAPPPEIGGAALALGVVTALGSAARRRRRDRSC
jgi:MYXO-CTERM domain-containing protein